MRNMQDESNQRLIMIVDDDQALGEMLSIVLESEGFKTVTCLDGWRAVEMFPILQPDLMLLDVMLPGLDGVQVAQRIRQNSNTPIIMLTAKSDTTDVVKGLEAGADDYVSKPFEVVELMARIRARLRMPKVNAPAGKDEGDLTERLQCGTLVMDRAEHTATKDGVDLQLTPTEFELLYVLAAHAGEALSRANLLKRVWGYVSGGDTRLVNVHVQRLRMKVETDPENPRIVQTVRVQKHLNASNLTGTDQYQQLVSNLASELQSNGSSNLVGVYLMERDAADSAERGFVPVSTEPEYSNLVSSSMRNRMRADTSGLIYYQPVRIPRTSGGTPGAVLGSVISSNNMGSLEVFALYSYQSQQQALSQIQINMLMVCVALSVLIGMIIFLVMRSVITPVRRVALATEIMASGTFDARVAVDRADEIGVLQKSFNEMAESLENQIEELEKAGDMQRSFISDVSHELRTPVTTMRMAADMLSMHKDEYDATTKRTVELLDGQIRRFQEMLADLLEISRFDAGYAALDLVEADIREPIEQSVEAISAIAQTKHVPLDVHMPNVEVLVRIDTRRISRVVRNLLANAIDFAEGKPVEVRLAANQRMVVISVRDYGVGMTSEQCSRMFDRFWRADPSRARTTGGTGLGMSIVLADTKLHHGDVAVRSRLGEGTWFLVTLPRNPDDVDCGMNNAPIRFATDGDDMRVVGGFGVADNGFVDYLTNKPMVEGL